MCYGEMEQGRCSSAFILQAYTEMQLTLGCLFGWKLSSFPLFIIFFATHSISFPGEISLLSITVNDNQMLTIMCSVCGWKDAQSSSLSSVSSFCLNPKTSSSLPQLCIFPQVNSPAPSLLCLSSTTLPPPRLPACCFPREVNLLSAGSMNSTGLELRPTHLPNIAHVLCIAPACRISQTLFRLLLCYIFYYNLVSKKIFRDLQTI